MTIDALPSETTLLWRESRGPLWHYVLSIATFSGDPSRGREVSVSIDGVLLGEAGIGSRTRFLKWEEIEAIDPAEDPDLAIIRLRNEPPITLDEWHLHGRRDKYRDNKVARLEALRSCLQLAQTK